MNILACENPAQALRFTLGLTVSDVVKFYGGTRKRFGEMEADPSIINKLRGNAFKGVYADYRDKIDCPQLELEEFCSEHLDGSIDEEDVWGYLSDHFEAEAPGAGEHYRPIVMHTYIDDGGHYHRACEAFTVHLSEALEDIHAIYNMFAGYILRDDYVDIVEEVAEYRARIIANTRVQGMAFFEGKDSLKRHLDIEMIGRKAVLRLAFAGVAAPNATKTILGVENIDAFSREERVIVSAHIPSYDKLLLERAEHAELEYDHEYLSFIQNREDYLLFVLKRVTAMVLARNGHRIFSRMIYTAKEQEINEVIVMKTIASIREEIGNTLREVEEMLDEDFSDLLLVAVREELDSL
ncbi:hypothetical protein L4D76_25130 [Photobacterium sagamiensis]|uniref:hypothetical protein n=1 Tax=Photobacterium sagamiensis TaxID=2910241 RepID=UPI003D0F2E50